MRFDDRLATALAQPVQTPAARDAVWRQLVDLLAQTGADDPVRRSEALLRLEQWRAEVPPVVRQGVALMLTERQLPADLVRFFAADSTAVSAPFLAAAMMAPEEWAALIPSLSPVARALLRHRRDLPAEATRMLQLFGNSDLIIETVPSRSVAEPEPDSTVRHPIVDSFSFESDVDGRIHWIDLPTRGAVIGLSIAHPAPPESAGVDGQAAGAFRRRTSFREARLLVGGSTAASGDWTIAGVPVFDPRTGRFTGYRGTARRPLPDERAEPVLDPDTTRDSIRQLSHELRTPLNAISGFAEMIEQQMLGPIASLYRERAAAILAETRRIEAVLDDLDDAAQLERVPPAQMMDPVDCAVLVARLVSTMSPAAAERGVLIGLSVAPRCESALLDYASAERMMRRLLSSAVGLAGAGEQIDVLVAPGGGAHPQTCITVSRPQLLQDMDEPRMLAACDVDGEDAEAAPPLGLGFSLRLIRSLAEGCGGELEVADDRFSLRLAALSISHGRSEAPEPVTLDACSLGD